MGARTVKFGLTLPQFGASWSEVKEIASLADEAGWDSVWVADHFLGVGSARCLPRPTRKPHPPILIGGAGEKVLLKLVARYADIWNNLGAFHREIGAKLEVLRRHCQRVGRSFDEIEISQQTVGAIGLSRDEARRRTEEVHREIGFLTGAPELCPTGTPDEIVSRLRESVQRGISSFVISFGRHAGAESLRLFAREVIPAFR